MLRFFLLFCALARIAVAATPPVLEAALKTFRGDPPPGWSFTQSTHADGASVVERSDATKAVFDRWSLVEKDGRAPTTHELREYADLRSRRSPGGTAPKITEQLDLTKIETVADTADRVTYRCPLLPGEEGDGTAKFLRATIVVHKPTTTIESIELASTGEFAPTFGVKIAEMKTTMTYALPFGDTPALPQKVMTRLRGKAFVFKSLDGDMTVTFSDYAKATKPSEKSAKDQPPSTKE